MRPANGVGVMRGQPVMSRGTWALRRQGQRVVRVGWGAVVAVAACAVVSGGDVRATEVGEPAGVDFFEAKIRPLLVAKCFACHSAETKPAGGLRVDERAGLLSGGGSGPALVPGDSDAGQLFARLLTDDADKRMPQDSDPLTESEIADLRRWVESGLAWPESSLPTVDAGEDLSDLYEDLRADHWAWQPLGRPEVPSPSDAAWPVADVDRYILAKLESAGLKPVADADRGTWLRRVTFDLTGLPPTADQLAAFLADDSDRAFENVVDGLLASDAFGERWGRHWLDVARYGESTGPSRNIPYPHAWRYRDYVIDSVREDVPIDQFIREQVAGDLIAASRPELTPAEQDRLLIATGYLALGVKDVNQRFKERFDMDNVDEQIDVLTRGVLGLTVSCARCHDHKFDPIPTADYYALAGIFTSTANAAGVRNKMGGSGLAYYDPDNLIVLREQGEGPDAGVVEAARERLAKAQAEWDAIRDTPEGLAMRPNGQRVQRRFKVELDAAQAEFDALAGPQSGRQLVHGLRESATVADTAIRYRGEAEKAGGIVARGYLTAFEVPGASEIDREQSGRLQLAEWLTSAYNPLAPRVAANQIWQHLFGEGIVPTADNFGTTGASPSNPELLDYLANRLIELGWSRKAFVRELVLSRAYRLSSQADADNLLADPANRLQWRHTARRLSAEEIRDAVLAATDGLDRARGIGSAAAELKMIEMADNGGEAKKVHEQADTSRLRSIYLPLMRGVTPRSLEPFDPAEQTLVTVRRDTTNVPTQALFLLNSPFIRERVASLAEPTGLREQAIEESIREAYLRFVSREPAADEIESAARFLRELTAAEAEAAADESDSGDQPVSVEAWSVFYQALIGGAEFRYLR